MILRFGDNFFYKKYHATKQDTCLSWGSILGNGIEITSRNSKVLTDHSDMSFQNTRSIKYKTHVYTSKWKEYKKTNESIKYHDDGTCEMKKLLPMGLEW